MCIYIFDIFRKKFHYFHNIRNIILTFFRLSN